MVRRSPRRRASSRGRRPRSAVVYRHSAQRTGPPKRPARHQPRTRHRPGRRPRRRDRRPAVPAAAARGRAGASATPASTSTAPAGSSSRARASCWRCSALAVLSYGAERSGANRQAGGAGPRRSLAVVLGALLFAGALAAARPLGDSGPDGRRGVRGAGAARPSAACWSGPGGASTRARRGCSPSTRTWRRWCSPRWRSSWSRSAYLAIAAFVAAARARAASRASASTRACESCGERSRARPCWR